jgi:predicted signal transduction protein with EAL and GGDEF domain
VGRLLAMVPVAVQLAIYAALSPLVAAARGAEVSYDALFRAADAALYEAKRAGRDRVVVDGDAADVRLAGGNVRRRAA